MNDRLFDIYMRSPYLSIKLDSYFAVYEQLFARFVGKPVTFVEIGVLNGGSLFMWRDYLGPQARIIGIDLNPAARQWETAGFEIHIGNQADPRFWQEFFRTVGQVDILLDDGGHTNLQQIVTVASSLEHVRDGGMIVVEDTHTSYFRHFGNPSRRSFISFAKRIVDSVNARYPSVPDLRQRYGESTHSVSFFESIVGAPAAHRGVAPAVRDRLDREPDPPQDVRRRRASGCRGGGPVPPQVFPITSKRTR